VLIAASEQTPNLDVLRVALAIMHIELTEPDEARAIHEDFAAAGVTSGPRGLGWSATLASLAEVSARLDDTRYTQELRTALAPYTGQLIIAGWGTICLGAADRYLGMLAATGGRPAEAEALFNAALALEESVGSAPLTSRTRVAHARALVRSGDANEVRRATHLLNTAAHVANRLGMAGLMHEIDIVRRERPRRN
jgi:hypothetical protein